MHDASPSQHSVGQCPPDWPLTDAMIADLATHVGFENIAAVIADARSGNSSARRELVRLSLRVSSGPFMAAWHGTLGVNTVGDAFSAELNVHMPAPSRAVPKSAPARRDTSAADPRPSQFIPPVVHMIPPPWKKLAQRGGFRISALNKTEIEILSIVDRVLVQREGWTRKDKARQTREAINLIPSRLALHGRKKCKRTYQRAISRLVTDKILLVAGFEPGGTRLYVPFWWPKSSVDEAESAWRLLASPESAAAIMSHQCRADVAPTSHPRRPIVAPTVATRMAAKPFVCKRVGPAGVRHIHGHLTSYFDYRTLYESGVAFLVASPRGTPCPPNGQARRAVLYSGGASDDTE